jgi:hypothetical protein
VILQPALVASSCQRRNKASSAAASGASFFNGWRATPGTISSDQPTRLADLDDRDDGAMLLEGGEASAQIVGLGHERLHLLSATMVPSPRRLPHTIFNRRTAKSISHIPHRTAAQRGR